MFIKDYLTRLNYLHKEEHDLDKQIEALITKWNGVKAEIRLIENLRVIESHPLDPSKTPETAKEFLLRYDTSPPDPPVLSLTQADCEWKGSEDPDE